MPHRPKPKSPTYLDMAAAVIIESLKNGAQVSADRPIILVHEDGREELTTERVKLGKTKQKSAFSEKKQKKLGELPLYRGNQPTSNTPHPNADKEARLILPSKRRKDGRGRKIRARVAKGFHSLGQITKSYGRTRADKMRAEIGGAPSTLRSKRFKQVETV